MLKKLVPVRSPSLAATQPQSPTRTISRSSCSLCSDNRFPNDGVRLADSHEWAGVDAQQRSAGWRQRRMNLLVVTNLYPPQSWAGTAGLLLISYGACGTEAPHSGTRQQCTSPSTNSVGPSGKRWTQRLNLKKEVMKVVFVARPAATPSHSIQCAHVRSCSTASAGTEFCLATDLLVATGLLFRGPMHRATSRGFCTRSSSTPNAWPVSDKYRLVQPQRPCDLR